MHVHKFPWGASSTPRWAPPLLNLVRSSCIFTQIEQVTRGAAFRFVFRKTCALWEPLLQKSRSWSVWNLGRFASWDVVFIYLTLQARRANLLYTSLHRCNAIQEQMSEPSWGALLYASNAWVSSRDMYTHAPNVEKPKQIDFNCTFMKYFTNLHTWLKTDVSVLSRTSELSVGPWLHVESSAESALLINGLAMWTLELPICWRPCGAVYCREIYGAWSIFFLSCAYFV